MALSVTSYGIYTNISVRPYLLICKIRKISHTTGKVILALKLHEKKKNLSVALCNVTTACSQHTDITTSSPPPFRNREINRILRVKCHNKYNRS